MLFRKIGLKNDLRESKKAYRKAKEKLAELRIELAKLKVDNEDCCRRLFRYSKLALDIKEMLESNYYNQPEIKIRKINELIRNFEATN